MLIVTGELFNRFVVALQPTGYQLVVLAGNYDSVAMLNESRALIACLNSQVITITTCWGCAIFCAAPLASWAARSSSACWRRSPRITSAVSTRHAPIRWRCR